MLTKSKLPSAGSRMIRPKTDSAHWAEPSVSAINEDKAKAYLHSHGLKQQYMQHVPASCMGRIVRSACEATCNLKRFLMLGNVLFLPHNNYLILFGTLSVLLLLCNNLSYIISMCDNIYPSCFDLPILCNRYRFAYSFSVYYI